MLGLALAMLIGAAPPAPAPSYLALGDSYTIGESVEPSERWPVRLATRLRKDGIAIGDPTIIARTGWTTDELDAALDRAHKGTSEPQDGNGGKLQPPYALVTLLIGVNNQYRSRPVEEYRTQLRALIQRAIIYAGGNPGRVILVSIPDWSATPFAAGSSRDLAQIAREIDAYNAVKREEAARSGTTFVDITPGSRKAAKRPDLVAGDGLHPSAIEYERWAKAVYEPARALLNP